MNDKHNESLSAFLDGELTDPEALDVVLRQKGCHKAFASLCQQRDALHGQINVNLPNDFAEQVAQAIAEEPTVLSPSASRSPAPVVKAQPARQGKVVQGWFTGRAPSVAIAASVAALGFVGLVMFSENASNRDAAQLAQSNVPAPVVNNNANVVAVAPSLSVREEAVRPVTSDVRSIDFNSLSPKLRAQLIQHMEAARQAQQVGGAKPSNISYQLDN